MGINIEDKQVDYLILLVGGNPLPNAVAGVLLSRPGGHITLLHSEGAGGTSQAAGNLETWLAKMGRTVSRMPVDAYDPAKIRDIVKEIVKKAPPAASVGLHYTGGTKAMAVHAHRSVERNTNGRAVVFSYLDSQRLRIVFDPADDTTLDCDTWAIGAAFNIGLEDLFALHSWKLVGWRGVPVMIDAAKKLASLYTADDGAAWVEWKNAELYPRCKSSGTWLEEEALRDVRLPFPIPSKQPALEVVEQALRQCLGDAQGESEFQIGDAASRQGISAKSLCVWLDGQWLESVVLQALLEIRERCDLHDIRMNITPIVVGKDAIYFEVDVVAMRGYQLFTFSCSTTLGAGMHPGARAELKRKLFEACVRTHQLGGDEACLALVAPVNGAGSLQHELRSGIVSENRVYVFGRGSWRDLGSAFANWIKKESGGGR